MNFEPPPNHRTDAQDEDFELVDGYLLRVRHRATLPHFVSFISPEKNRSQIAPTVNLLASSPAPDLTNSWKARDTIAPTVNAVAGSVI